MITASIGNMKWLRNIKKRLMLGKRRYTSFAVWVKKVKWELEAITGGVLQSASNNYAKFTVKHLC